MVVIGAGPAGSHLAARLAGLGHGVVLLEKASRPGAAVCCTGIIGRPCLDLLAVDDALVYRASSSASFVAPSGRRIQLGRPETVGWIVDRPALDRALADRAVARGAALRCEARAEAVTIDADGATVTLADGEALQTRCVVLATGHGSRLPVRLGLGKIADTAVACQVPVEAPELAEVEVLADPAIAPGGFAWLAPTAPGRAWVGLFTRGEPARALDALTDRLRRAGRIGATLGPACSAALPLRPLERTTGDRLLVVGEAAGQLKPTTGGGIYYGALCADLAAEVLHGALLGDTLDAASLHAYERRWRAALEPELSVGYAAHRLWRRLGAAEVELILRVASRSGLADRALASPRFSFDWHGPLLLQLADLLPAPTVTAPDRSAVASSS